MRLADETTLDRVLVISVVNGGLNAAARCASPDNPGPIAGAMSDVINHKTIALERENELRIAIGLESLPRTDKRPVCPIHDVVHDCTCDGTQGVAQWVHPKERIVKAPGFGRTRKERRTIEVPPEAYAIMVEWRERIGGGWFETIRAMDYLARGVTRD